MNLDVTGVETIAVTDPHDVCIPQAPFPVQQSMPTPLTSHPTFPNITPTPISPNIRPTPISPQPIPPGSVWQKGLSRTDSIGTF
jgi:hypothetical protein